MQIQEIKNQVSKSLKDVADLLQSENNQNLIQLKLDTYVKELTEESTRIKEGAFKIIVLGDFNRGKSSLINALLGQNLLPTEPIPCTAIINQISYGNPQRVTIHLQNGEKIELSLKEFQDKYILKTKTIDFNSIKGAVIYTPHELLKNKVRIYDTPGLNENPLRNQLTINNLGDSQLIVFVLSATKQIEMQERTYIQNYLAHFWQHEPGTLPSIFFVINLWDNIAVPKTADYETKIKQARQSVRDFFTEGLAELLYGTKEKANIQKIEGLWNKRIFAVSAKEALERQYQGKAFDDLGVGFLQKEMMTFLRADRLSSEIQVAFNRFSRIDAKIDHQIKIVLPQVKQSANQLQEKLQAATVIQRNMTKLLQTYYKTLSNTSITIKAHFRELIRAYKSDTELLFDKHYDNFTQNINLGFSQALQQHYIDSVSHAFERWFEREMRIFNQKFNNEFEKQFAHLQRDVRGILAEYNIMEAQWNKLFNESKLRHSRNYDFLPSLNITLSLPNDFAYLTKSYTRNNHPIMDSAKNFTFSYELVRVLGDWLTGGAATTIALVGGTAFTLFQGGSKDELKQKLRTDIIRDLKYKIANLMERLNPSMENSIQQIFEKLKLEAEQLEGHQKDCLETLENVFERAQQNKINAVAETERLNNLSTQLKKMGVNLQKILTDVRKI